MEDHAREALSEGVERSRVDDARLIDADHMEPELAGHRTHQVVSLTQGTEYRPLIGRHE
jgi:hypothetical protein